MLLYLRISVGLGVIVYRSDYIFSSNLFLPLEISVLLAAELALVCAYLSILSGVLTDGC